MRLISQGKEINCFEGMSLNGLSLMRILFLFDREQGFRGRKEINLLVHACRSILPLFPSFFFLSFFLPFLSQCLLILLRFSHRGCYYSAFCDCDPPLCTVRPLFYSSRRDRILPFQPLTTFFWLRCPCRPLTSLSVTQPPPLTYAGRDTGQRRLFCLFTCCATV